jgi:hypothetical protein
LISNEANTMTEERKARIANGLIVLVSGLLACFVDPRFGWISLFMGASLIFSGSTGFCGFAVLFRRLGV